MSSVDEIVKYLVLIPVKFTANEKSLLDHVVESGYPSEPNGVSLELIHKELGNSPELVDCWVRWSEDKRADSGWYLKPNERGEYIVGYYHSGSVHTATVFVDRLLACATFIINEIKEANNSHIIDDGPSSPF